MLSILKQIKRFLKQRSCDFTLAACFVEWEGTSGGRGVSKYDFIEPANAVNDGNWKANVIINVRRLI